MPDAADLAAHDAASAALTSRPELLEAALEEIEALDASRKASRAPATGLLPYVLDLRNASTGNAMSYQRATERLLDRDDLDPQLRGRLKQDAEDHPLHLADRRIRDAHLLRFGSIFNALVEPLGRSLVSTALLPLRLSQALVGIALMERERDELSLPERQALIHRKSFIEANPSTPEAVALLDDVEEEQRRWYRTQRDLSVRAARRSLRAGHDRSALLLAERALFYAPEDRTASALRAEALAGVEQTRSELARSLEAAPSSPESAAGGRALAVALLTQPDQIEARAKELLTQDADGPHADEARFALALVTAESGAEAEGWRKFGALAKRRDRKSNMARHARALVESPEENPYAFFRRAQRDETRGQVRWLVAGPLAGGARERELPRPIEWIIEIPALVAAVVGLPNRLLRFPWAKPQSDVPPVFARRYLARFPEGEHADQLAEWLQSHEASRGNWLGALELAEQRSVSDPEDLGELRQRAARQALEAAERPPRRDVRLALLGQVAKRFPETEAGKEAGEAARRLVREATPQHIRISRGFLVENRDVAGPEGLALRFEFLDGELPNGELHPEGVTLLGGRVIELAFVNDEGDARGEPVRRRRKVSDERLARVVAMVEEAALARARTDPDFQIEPDADRDLFFERVRLGVADQPDLRPTAQSSYTFEGTRERYGLVRSRESILPVELVLQISGTDLGLGAFPRVRMPKTTPDALLYR
jgi:hypothetical protein